MRRPRPPGPFCPPSPCRPRAPGVRREDSFVLPERLRNPPPPLPADDPSFTPRCRAYSRCPARGGCAREVHREVGVARAARELAAAVPRFVRQASHNGVGCRRHDRARFGFARQIPLTASKELPSYRSIKSGNVLIGVLEASPPLDRLSRPGSRRPASIPSAMCFNQSRRITKAQPRNAISSSWSRSGRSEARGAAVEGDRQKSGKATGGTHPVVMLLFPYPKPPAEPTVVEGKANRRRHSRHERPWIRIYA